MGLVGVAFSVAVEVIPDPSRRIAPGMPIDLGGESWGNALNAATFAMILVSLGQVHSTSVRYHEKRPTSFRSGRRR